MEFYIHYMHSFCDFTKFNEFMSNHKILVLFENWKNIKQLKFVAKIVIMAMAGLYKQSVT